MKTGKRSEMITMKEISPYIPYNMVRPADYELQREFVRFIESFDSFCKRRLSKIKPDAFNRSYLDQEIFSAGLLAIKDLHRQRIRHMDNLRTLQELHECNLQKMIERRGALQEELNDVNQRILEKEEKMKNLTELFKKGKK